MIKQRGHLHPALCSDLSDLAKVQPSHRPTNKPLDLNNTFLPASLAREALEMISTLRRRMIPFLSYQQTQLFLSICVVLGINGNRFEEAETLGKHVLDKEYKRQG